MSCYFLLRYLRAANTVTAGTAQGQRKAGARADRDLDMSVALSPARDEITFAKRIQQQCPTRARRCMLAYGAIIKQLPSPSLYLKTFAFHLYDFTTSIR